MTPTANDLLSWDERWGTFDRGLKTSWEAGRVMALSNQDIADRARRGELPTLPWRGGVTAETKIKNKKGVLFYYAFWLGLRGEPLDIEPSSTYYITCSLTNVTVEFSKDIPSEEANTLL